MTDSTLLSLEGLSVSYRANQRIVRAVDDVTFQIGHGEIIGLVGESGSGKSATAQAILGLAQEPTAYVTGSIKLLGDELVGLAESRLRRIRGTGIALIPQEPMVALNPIMTIGDQLEEAVRVHGVRSRAVRLRKIVDALEAVGVSDAAKRLKSYPHEFSGGMRQRVMIAMALCNEPKLIVADEPTTALDVTVQAQILDLIEQVNREFGTAVLLITHNLSVVAERCERVVVMYSGRVVEDMPAATLFARPLHPYTRGLMRSVPQLTIERGQKLESLPGMPPAPDSRPPGCAFGPRCDYFAPACSAAVPALVSSGGGRVACVRVRQLPEVRARSTNAGKETETRGPAAANASEPVLEVVGLRKLFSSHKRRGGATVAVDGVSLALMGGETLGVVGESGCGKSTLARSIMGVWPVDAGKIVLLGKDLGPLAGREARAERRHMQMVFQDPYSSLDPRCTVGSLIAEPIRNFGTVPRAGVSERVAELLELVGLPTAAMTKFPHAFSGGQRQRVAIARALAVHPAVLILDEPLSALDVSIQAQISNLLLDLQNRLKLSYLFISHDMPAVRQLSDRVAVMYLGGVVETGPTDQLFESPLHPYTRSLLAAVPSISASGSGQTERLRVVGEIGATRAPESGCRFAERCPLGPQRHRDRTICRDVVPELREVTPGRVVACHFWQEVATPSMRDTAQQTHV